ncbi:thioredoxin, mitochondrial [Arapaima gigas]
MMACRHVTRRLWSWSVKDLRCLRASLSSHFSPPHPAGTQYFLSLSRSLSHPLSFTPCRGVSFNVQDTEDFTQRVVNSDLPVIVDFHAQWCGPCKILGPRLEKAIAKQQGRVTMAKVDIDDHTDLAIEYGVSAVPTVVAMRGGKVLDQFVGIKDEDQLDSFVSKLVGP